MQFHSDLKLHCCMQTVLAMAVIVFDSRCKADNTVLSKHSDSSFDATKTVDAQSARNVNNAHSPKNIETPYSDDDTALQPQQTFLDQILSRNIRDTALSDKGTKTIQDGAVDNACATKSPGEACDLTRAMVCNKHSQCVSACEYHGYLECHCAHKDESYCYLCCGRSNRQCRPAHEHGIFKFNGERWERSACRRCRSELRNGDQCDDKDRNRVCVGELCVRGVCHGKPDGSVCNYDRSKVCIQGECDDPCKLYRSDLTLCECPKNSAYQCQLCCNDWRTQKCSNAFHKYGLKATGSDKPIFRVGLSCGRYDHTCNRLGECSGASFGLSVVLLLLCLCLSRCVYFM